MMRNRKLIKVYSN